MSDEKPTEINEKTKLPLSIVFAVVFALASAAAGYGGTLAAIETKVSESKAREIARDEIRAAQPADRADVAVLAQRVESLERQLGKVADGQDKTLEILRDLAQRK